jgi:hypothetical protein
MSDGAQGSGWWVASDGKWYAPEQHPNHQAPLPAPPLPNPPGVGAQPPHYVITSAPPKNRKRKGRVFLMVLGGLGVLIALLITVLIIVGLFVAIHSSHSNSSTAVLSSTSCELRTTQDLTGPGEASSSRAFGAELD